MGDGEADGEAGGAFSADDLVGGGFDVGEDFGAVADGEFAVLGNGPVAEEDVADIGGAPEGDFGFAMFTDDVTVNIGDGDVAAAGDEVSEARAVEDGAAAEDAAAG